MKKNKIIATSHYFKHEVVLRMDADLHIDKPLREIYVSDCNRINSGREPLTFTKSQIHKLEHFFEKDNFDYFDEFYLERNGERHKW